MADACPTFSNTKRKKRLKEQQKALKKKKHHQDHNPPAATPQSAEIYIPRPSKTQRESTMKKTIIFNFRACDPVQLVDWDGTSLFIKSNFLSKSPFPISDKCIVII